MAIFSFADLQSAMPQLYRELRPQMQRKAPTLSVLAMKQCNTGQNIGWDVTFSGQNAGAVNPEGGNMLTASADTRVPATLGFGAASAPIKVTTKAQAVGGAIPGGVPGDFFNNLVNQNTAEAMNALVKYINQQIYTGTGAGNQMTGLSTAVAATGVYANINPSTNPQWASTMQGNSGTLRNISLALIKNIVASIAIASPKGRPNLASCTPTVFNSLENLFDGTLQTQAGKNDLMWGKVQTNGGLIEARGFRSLVWQSAGLTFIEDPDCQNSAMTNPANAMYFFNTDSVEMQFIPPAPLGNYAPDQQIINAVEQDIGPIAGLMLDFRARGRTTFADEFDILALLNVVVKDRAACGVLSDIQ